MPHPSDRNPRAGAALACLLGGTFVVTLDFFVVAVALPSIQADLGASDAQLQWVVSGYGLAFACALIACGRLGDRHGHRRMFAAGVLLFTAASAACGLAATPAVLLLARGLQGVGAAAITPQVLALLGTLFEGSARARAFAWYGLALGSAATSGQLLGGLLIEAAPAGLGWRACFLVNLPVGAALLAAVPRVLPHDAPRPGARADLVGAALLALGLWGLIRVAIDLRTPDGPGLAVPIAGALGLSLFGLRQRALAASGGTPLLPAGLLAAPGYAAGLAAAFAFYLSNGSFYYVLSIYLQRGRGLDALGGGLVFTALALGFFAASLGTPALTRRWGQRVPAAGALLVTAGHLAQATLAADGVPPLTLLATLLVLQGAGIGLIMAPLAAAVLARAPAAHAGVASGVYATVQWVGNAVGVALVGLPFHAAIEGVGTAAAADYQQGFAWALAALAGLTTLFWGLLAASGGRAAASVRADRRA